MFELHPQLAQDAFYVADLPLSRLLLINDANYPWYVLVPRVESVKEIYQLSESDQQQFLRESSTLTQVLEEQFKADKMNVAALGNMVPQLHVHHIARFETDPCWPKPVWGQVATLHYDVAFAQTRMQKTKSLLQQRGLLEA